MLTKIQFTTATLKRITQYWQQALRQGEIQLLKRLTALQQLAAKVDPPQLLSTSGSGTATGVGEETGSGVTSFLILTLLVAVLVGLPGR